MEVQKESNVRYRCNCTSSPSHIEKGKKKQVEFTNISYSTHPKYYNFNIHSMQKSRMRYSILLSYVPRQ